MSILVKILMGASGVALILAILMGFNIVQGDLLNVSGRGFLELSIAGTLYAMGLHFITPFGGGDGGGSEG